MLFLLNHAGLLGLSVLDAKTLKCDMQAKLVTGRILFPSVVCCGVAGLEHYDDINQPVSKAEADAIREIVERAVASVLPGAQTVLTGGFRRLEIIQFFHETEPCSGKSVVAADHGSYCPEGS